MIEVTEDAFVAKTHFQDEILPIFRKLGVGISIDDFGIGYSSLSALADITADEIKIDRSFITDIHKRPRSQGILRAIESLSEALGMTVIAEGIESFEELAYLQAATKIRYAQGYYFSRPVFLEELKPAAPILSESRVSSASRPREEARHVARGASAIAAEQRFDDRYFDSTGSGGTLSFGAPACMVISVIETRS
jgi:cyclic di-GMP phosphodiesterase Gmr